MNLIISLPNKTFNIFLEKENLKMDRIKKQIINESNMCILIEEILIEN